MTILQNRVYNYKCYCYRITGGSGGGGASLRWQQLLDYFEIDNMLNDQNVSVLVKQKQKLFIDLDNYIYLIPTFIKYLLSIYYVLGTILSTEDAAVHKKAKVLSYTFSSGGRRKTN